MTYTLKLYDDDNKEVQKLDELKLEEAAFYVASIFMKVLDTTKAVVINDISGECKEYDASNIPVVHAIQKQDEDYSRDERKFRVEGVSGDVSLYRDKIKRGDGIYYGLQHGIMLKSHYSDADRYHSNRMREITPIKDGDKVIINGELYVCKVAGNYSDCCTFEKVGD